MAVTKEQIVDIARCIEALYGRWLDERQYEDFADYEKVIRAKLPEGAHDIKVAKRPFGVMFHLTGPRMIYRVHIRVQGDDVVWSTAHKSRNR